MNDRHGELTRRRDRRASTLSRRTSHLNQTSDDDSEFSRRPSPLLAVDSGYRVDPFTPYPVTNPSRGVRYMVDYYTQIWAPQQASASSLISGRNTLVTLVLPLALQNAMLFEATIAMTRAAWVIRRGSEPFNDKMLLRHRGYAMEELRNSLSGSGQSVSAYVLLTMSTLLTMNYMINDTVSFRVHLQALEKMLESLKSEETEILHFVRGRVLAFGVLASFLQAHQPRYATRINELGHRISTLTYPGHPFPSDLCEVASKLPEGFSEVALSRSIATEFISFLAKLTELVKWMPLTQARRVNGPQPGLTMQRAIYDLQCLSALSLTSVEGQIVRATLAFCLHVYNELSFRIPLARPLKPLLESFNEHNEIPRQPWLQRCLLWSAIVTASAWDTQVDAQPRTHVVLDKMMRLLPEANYWEETKELMQKFFWLDSLQDQWEICWRAAYFRKTRQRRGASQVDSISQLLQDSAQISKHPSSEVRIKTEF
ncbi:uncharacterized protein A1O9_09694 [Exophiala aquamarina CBS 119918]|uniref:Transcription factor domain-containing protein n=1 Tax=Exophiala aquamarina CBS 119918 TaxID=1182545 RepID=A0A072P491_9EURO|nr:uncharacterized protein A1O9_09694 [Exophiala aquamarina CBS 119918]KEF54527.1 hypothetical protein A1O9_09694 [Exophiala aquamarina CBS 119918]